MEMEFEENAFRTKNYSIKKRIQRKVTTSKKSGRRIYNKEVIKQNLLGMID